MQCGGETANSGQLCRRQERCTHDLKLDSLSLELDGSDLEVDLIVNATLPRDAARTPMVEMYDSVYVSSAKRSRRHDFPTPESPINKS